VVLFSKRSLTRVTCFLLESEDEAISISLKRIGDSSSRRGCLRIKYTAPTFVILVKTMSCIHTGGRVKASDACLESLVSLNNSHQSAYAPP
jgi:hypothetical protein